MEITREIINNSEIRSHLTISKLKTILLVSLISFTSLLVRQTLQVQHSCKPMIYWSGNLPPKCQVAVNNDFDSFDKSSSSRTLTSINEFGNSNDFSSPTKQEFETPKQQPSIAQNTVKPQVNKIINSTNTEPEITQNISSLKPEDEYNSVGHFVKEHSNDIVGAAAGVAGGVATVAAASATAAFSIPVAGAVAIGMGIWFLIRSVF